MRYMFLMYSKETDDGPTPEDVVLLKRDHSALISDATQKGILLAVEGLKSSLSATSIRMEHDKPVITDGPFAETKEQLAGFYILECADLDEAIEWAARMRTGCKGSPGGIEIRPVADLPRS